MSAWQTVLPLNIMLLPLQASGTQTIEEDAHDPLFSPNTLKNVAIFPVSLIQLLNFITRQALSTVDNAINQKKTAALVFLVFALQENEHTECLFLNTFLCVQTLDF